MESEGFSHGRGSLAVGPQQGEAELKSAVDEQGLIVRA